MKVVIYVEEPSDQRALEALLDALLVCLRAGGIEIEFIPTEGKRRLMRQVPIKAANILSNDERAMVIALPRLYSPNPSYTYATPEEQSNIIQQAFRREMKRKQQDLQPAQSRFFVFCLKPDLEVLVLAAEPQLASRLGISSLPVSWVKPVEDIPLDHPSKEIVKDLFEIYGDRYQDTVDAALILGSARYLEIAEACPQCFAPFVERLESLLA